MTNSPTGAELAALLERFDRPGPRYTSYPTAVEFTDGFGAEAYVDRLADFGRRDDDLAVYVHLPFCDERCTYCACNVVSSPLGRRVAEPYLARLDQEIDRVADHIGRRARVTQVHFGGGTPTYHTPSELDALVGKLQERFEWGPFTEASIEADPRVTDHDQLAVLANRGFSRLSVGVQDLDPDVQEAIGRHQSGELTRTVVADARSLGFRSVNVDLVYGLPRQTAASLRRTMEAVIELNPDRLAIYSFAYLPKAFAHQRRIDEADVPRGGEKVELLHLVREALFDAGYVDIGIDHFARADDALAIAQREGRLRRDFMGYTTREATEYVGFGVSAIGFIGGAYAQNVKKLSRYYEAIDGGSLPIERGVQLDADDERRAHVIAELMCNFIVDKAAFRARFGDEFDALFAADLERMEPLLDGGFVIDESDALRLTPTGRFLARNAAICFDRYRRGSPTGRFSQTL